MNEDKLTNMLGLAQKARKIVSGEFATDKALKEQKAEYVLVAADASEKTAEKYRELTEKQNIPLAMILNKDKLAHALGKETRAVAAITDAGFGKAIGKLLQD